MRELGVGTVDGRNGTDKAEGRRGARGPYM